MITFQWLWAFALLPLPLLVRWLVPPAGRARAGALRVPFFRELAAAGLTGASGRSRQLLQMAALTLIWLLLVAAAARPVYQGKPVAIPVEGRDIMLAVDLSESMATGDMGGAGAVMNRLMAVKAVVDNFIDHRKGDRLGLIVFGQLAFVQAPLTFDRNAVRDLLASSSIGMVGGSTAMGDAIALAMKTLRTRPEDERILILLTDGANTAGALDPLDAAELARQEHVKIYTIGVGSDVLPTGQPTALLGLAPDEATLKQIAATTGGRYFRARDAKGLAAIYDDIDRVEPVAGEPIYLTPSVSLFQWPLGLALVLSFALAALMAAPRRAGAEAPAAASAEGARP